MMLKKINYLYSKQNAGQDTMVKDADTSAMGIV